MALATSADLKSAVTNWMARTDLSGSAEDFITLAEARLNRELNVKSTEAALATVAGSNTVSTSALSVDQPLGLFLDTGDREYRLGRMQGASAVQYETAREPRQWEWDAAANVIRFDAPADAVYNLRFEYDERFALSDSVTTNTLLTNHPDVYLYATLSEAASYTQDIQAVQGFEAKLARPLARARRHYSEQRRGTAKVDPALLMRGHGVEDWRT